MGTLHTSTTEARAAHHAAGVAGERQIGDDAAEQAMTDLRHSSLPAVGEHESAAAARRRMAAARADAALVTGRNARVVGVLTARDLDTAAPNATSGEVMTPIGRLRARDHSDILGATLTDLIIAFKVERTHCLLVDEAHGATRRLRGVIAVSTLERLLDAAVAFVPRWHAGGH